MTPWVWGGITVVVLFLVRVGVPLAFLALLLYAFRHWESWRWATALGQWQAHPGQPGTPPAAVLKMLQEPCSAQPPRRGAGGAQKQLDVPCWVKQRQTEGRLPTACLRCERFRQTWKLEAAV